MDVKRQLTNELAAIVKVAVREDRAEHIDVLPSDILNSVCNVVEAIFIHGLKETKGAAPKGGVRKKSVGKAAYPEPNFWPFLEKFTHRNIRAQIGNLNQIKTDIGRSRAWIRIALNDRVLENYMSSILREQQIIKHFYNQRAYFRDNEQCDLMQNYTRALGKLSFKAPLNSSILNEWTPTPLKMAGLLVERHTPSHSQGGMVDMEEVMGRDENIDVPVAISALEYDGLDDPAFSDDMSDIRSESQFSIRSRPVAAYGDKRMIFSPDADSQSGSDCMHDSVGSLGAVGGRNRRQGLGELGNISESMTGDEEAQKLDAVLCAITGTALENDDGGKNPFSDSGVAASPPTETNVVIVHRHQNGVKKSPSPVAVGSLNEKETNITVDASIKNTENISAVNADAKVSVNIKMKADPAKTNDSSSSLPVDTEPKPIVNEERRFLEQLEMSFSPGNSLAAHGWSSPSFDVAAGAGSPSTSSVKYTERPLSSSVGAGSGGGFAALFSAVMHTANMPKCASDGGISGPSPRYDHPLDDSEKGVENLETEKAVEQPVAPVATKVVVLDDATGITTMDISVVASNRERKKSQESASSLDNFVLVEESQESLNQAAAQKSFRLSLLTKIADDAGLDVQGFKCQSCHRTIGLPLFGTYRVCSYDGHYYCVECHLNEEKVIPARVLFNWDFKPRPVSRASKAFLDHIADQPLIDFQKANSSLSDVVKAVNETKMLRLQLSYVAMYLLTCKESVADDLRKRVWPKEYLYSNVDMYSVSDLMDMHSGQLQKHLKAIVQYAAKHVLQQCRLCAQKGFICELCNDQKIIYAFQLDMTHRCPKCHAVYHTKCFNDKQAECPKCIRREMYTRQAERSSFSLDNMLPLGV